MENNTLRIRNEATLTSNGTHFHGNCKPVIAVDIHKTFNSLMDTAEYFGVRYEQVYAVLSGRRKTLGLYERDENGNKIRLICRCRLTYASNMESTVDALMTCGREATEKLNKVNVEVEDLKKENAELSAELAEFRAWKKAKEDYEKAVSVAKSVLASCKAKEAKLQEEYQLSIARRQNAERELAELKARDVYA